MKRKCKLQGIALVTAINLAIMGTTFAMPTGGNVTRGEVSGLVNGTVTNGGTLATVGGSAIINWRDFSINAGEILNFNTSAGALLNNVTGSQISQLYGRLNQTGGNPLLLVNHNGIVVGNGAVINATNLMLSTKNFSMDYFDRGYYIVDRADNTNKGTIEISGDAKVIASKLAMYGGRVQVEDNVTISSPDFWAEADNVLKFSGNFNSNENNGKAY